MSEELHCGLSAGMIRVAVYYTDAIKPANILVSSEELLREIAFDVIDELRESYCIQVALNAWEVENAVQSIDIDGSRIRN
jgi:hypothetical protein